MAKQFTGRKLAELVLDMQRAQDRDTAMLALRGALESLRPELRDPVLELVDFLVGMPQDQQSELFRGDLGRKFIELVDVEKGFFKKRYDLLISPEEAISVFNLLVVNWALACHLSPQTLAAMKKAAGIGLFGRLFRS